MVHCDGVRCVVTHPDLAHAFWGWKSRSSLSSPLRAAPVDLLDSPHLQVLHSGLVGKSGLHWFFCVPRSYVGAMSVHPHMSGILRLSDILQAALLAWYEIFFLHKMLLWMWYFLPVIWLSNVLLVTISWQHLHHLLLHLLLPVLVWWKPSRPEGPSGSLVYTLPRVVWGRLVWALWRHVGWAGVCWRFSSSWWVQGGMWLSGAHGVVVHAVGSIVGLKMLSPHGLNLDEWHHGVHRHSVQYCSTWHHEQLTLVCLFCI